MRHALFIAFHFPPEASSSGVLRTFKFTRYLPGCGWRATVVSPSIDAYSTVDRGLEAQVVAPTRVVRTRWLNTRRHLALRGKYPALLALPDPWIGWLPWAVAAGRKILLNDPPALVYSTSPHATAHLIGLALTGPAKLPWVVDIRDPWYEEVPEPGAPSGPLYRSINRGFERRVLRRATRVVTTTAHLRGELCKRYPDLPADKFLTIPNGYDEADFTAMSPGKPSGERFVIVHSGSINGDFRDPRPLFRSIGRLAARGVLDPKCVELRFVGGGEYGDSADVRTALAETGLTNCVEFIARVPFDEALREISCADLLLLLQASEDTVGLVPAKLYEYLRARRPVIALVYEGASAEVMRTTGGGWAVDPRDESALDAALQVAYNAWAMGTLATFSANLDALRQFDRRLLTERLADVFDSVTRSADGG